MISEEKLAANRANAQKSTGPTTEKGKKRSCLNAMRHGLTAQLHIMPEEDAEPFDEFLGRNLVKLAPKGAVEDQICLSWALTMWRLNRIQAIEGNVFAMGNMLGIAEGFKLEHPQAHNAATMAKMF